MRPDICEAQRVREHAALLPERGCEVGAGFGFPERAKRDVTCPKGDVALPHRAIAQDRVNVVERHFAEQRNFERSCTGGDEKAVRDSSVKCSSCDEGGRWGRCADVDAEAAGGHANPGSVVGAVKIV